MTTRDHELLTYLAAGLLASILIVLLLAHIHHDIVHPRVERPLHVRDVTFKPAPKHRKQAAKNLTLDL